VNKLAVILFAAVAIFGMVKGRNGVSSVALPQLVVTQPSADVRVIDGDTLEVNGVHYRVFGIAARLVQKATIGSSPNARRQTAISRDSWLPRAMHSTGPAIPAASIGIHSMRHSKHTPVYGPSDITRLRRIPTTSLSDQHRQRHPVKRQDQPRLKCCW